MYNSDAGVSRGIEYVNQDWFRSPFLLEDYPSSTDGIMYIGKYIDGVYEVIEISKFPELVNLACKRAVEVSGGISNNLFVLDCEDRELEGQLYEVPAGSTPPALPCDSDGILWTEDGVFFPVYRNMQITRDEFIARYLDAETVDEYYGLIYGE